MHNKTETITFRDKWIGHIHRLQEKICAELEQIDEKESFITDKWERDQGGGGLTKVIQNGKVFEKGGVNTSVVYGPVTDQMRHGLGINGAQWFACGLSLVIHPLNPFVPTVHANWRYFELYDESNKLCDQWFGGGVDLTPYYLFEEDARHFHQTIKEACDPFGKQWYPKFKKQCDEYFVNSHRDNETRGIGGIFYDYMRPDESITAEKWMQFSITNGNAFLPAYIPIVQKRKETEYTPQHKFWQEIRRGRYVEFNLIHDRGTLFGLKTKGRTESILMSLPPTVRFKYEYQPEADSPEARLLEVCKHPKEWC